VNAEEIDLNDLENNIKISNRDSKALFFTLPDEFTHEWINLVSSASDYQKQAILFTLRQAVRGKLRDYLLSEGPKEFGIEILKLGYKIGKLYAIADMSVFVKEFEKMTVKQSLEYLGEWLLEGEAKVSMGDLDFSYESYKDKKEKHKFQYIILYYPETHLTGQGVIKIYSSKAMNSPVSRGSVGSMTGTAWLSKDEKISPFILTITGKMKRQEIGYFQSQFMHRYSWLDHPDISVEFPETVPLFDFEAKGFFESLGDRVKEFFKKFGKWFGRAAIVDPPELDIQEGPGLLTEIRDIFDNILEQLKLIGQNFTEAQKVKIEQEFKEVKEIKDTDDLEEKLADIEDQLDEILAELGQEQEEIEETRGLIINEVCVGFDQAGNEFIELYNSTSETIILEGDFNLKLVSSSNIATKKTIDWKKQVILPNSYFLLIGGDIGLESDAEFSSQLTSVSGVIIEDKEGNVLDKVAWGKQDQSPPQLAVEASGKVLEKGLSTNQSIERKNHLDINDNSVDFYLLTVPTPMNSKQETLALEQEEIPEVVDIPEDNNSPQYGGGPATTQINYCTQT